MTNDPFYLFTLLHEYSKSFIFRLGVRVSVDKWGTTIELGPEIRDTHLVIITILWHGWLNRGARRMYHEYGGPRMQADASILVLIR